MKGDEGVRLIVRESMMVYVRNSSRDRRLVTRYEKETGKLVVCVYVCKIVGGNGRGNYK